MIFLNMCKLKDSEVMLCLCCSAIFFKEASTELEKINPYQSKKGERQGQKKLCFNKRGMPQKTQRPKTYLPPYNVPQKEWFGLVGRSSADKGKWKLIEVSA